MKLSIIGIVSFALAMTWTVWTVLVSSAFGAAPTAITSNVPAIQEHIQLRQLPGIGHGPSGVAIIGDQLYALNATSFNIAVVKNNRVVKCIPIGERPIGGSVKLALHFEKPGTYYVRVTGWDRAQERTDSSVDGTFGPYWYSLILNLQ
jgi:hypothetical protein